ncbi:recombination protein NinB [Bordetella bronchiseptica]|uniref:recombination protein NinB n=1 Tax=Bordetella bronchiseptica TaxID=518 RepID=UPI0005B7FDBE|nr:recombination protein NinB [Bordetella bronchiseptica]
MAGPLYREYVLHGPNQAQAVWQMLKNNAAAKAKQGKPLRVIVTEAEHKRGLQQNRFYWGAVITRIADQAWVDGQQFSKDAWHEFYGRLFGICQDVTLPDGEVVTRRISTAEMNVGDFSDYCERVQAHAAAEFGVEFR